MQSLKKECSFPSAHGRSCMCVLLTIMQTKFLFVCGFLSLVIIPVNNENTTVYGYAGDSVLLVCPLIPPPILTQIWTGPPDRQSYFLGDEINPNLEQKDRLSLIQHQNSRGYNLQISNLVSGTDEGLYSCGFQSSPPMEYLFYLKLLVDVHNVTLDPSDNPLTIREGTQRKVMCVVNTNAVPAPTITWYLDSELMTTSKEYSKIGNRADNKKTLECRASNNNNNEKTTSTILNIEFPPKINTLSQHNVIEGETLSVTCSATSGNPASTTFYWTKIENQGFKENGPSLNLPNIQRTSSGTYNCTAENNYNNGEKGTDSQTMGVNVHYPPIVNKLFQQDIIEGRDLSVTCQATSGNPSSTTFYWTKENNSGFKQNGAALSLSNIQRANSGTYICTAENSYSNEQKGMHNQSMVVNVLYPPNVNTLLHQDIIEGRDLSVYCTATPGNPISTTFYWTKVDNSRFRQNGTTLQLYNIQRKSSGTYRCTAENKYSNGNNGSDSQFMGVNVLYPPVVNILSQQNITEGKDLTFTCQATLGNPNSTTFYWTKEDNLAFRQNGPTLQLYNIQKTSSGSYKCTAENIYYNGEKGINNQTMTVNVLYSPLVNNMSQQNVIEGENLTFSCQAIPGNPRSTTFHWTKVGNPEFRQNGPALHLPDIKRNSSGTYRCTAENIFSDIFKGNHSMPMAVNVLYKPKIVKKNHGTVVNEFEQVTLYRKIISNPLSNVSWYNGSDLFNTQWLVRNATFNIEKATCTDTRNFTLVANNGVQENDTALVELIVNCKPRSYKTNFTLGVTDTTGIDFSTYVIAYPEPLIKLEHENGTESNQMSKSINMNAVNNFTIHISQAVVNQSDFGVYNLKVWNSFGNLTMIVNVIPQRKPNVPVSIEIVCEETSAKVQWKSSFNGGDPQLFTVIASSGQQSNNISDKGENVIHSTLVQHLQPSTMYVFYVSAQNSHGFISSEKFSCTTLPESSEKLPIIVGSAAAGGLSLIVVVVVVVFLFRRFTNTEKQAGKSQRFENDLVENESVDDDGLKDNILYVSADPRENEKHEAAVYAAVNKKDQMSDNNSNVYAEVKKNGKRDVKEGAIYSDVKPKKGFFKKDGKVKKEKRQKRKQEVADVYENSDDIAMTANPDNVYSNTNHNNDSAKEQRGYKNKDGLLYVEVQFDTKTEDKNPVIHGDDEKTDYATVEFPVPSSSHDRE